MSGSAARGTAAEALALEFLTARGLELLERNFRCRAGEIDLIMRDDATLVFVEVRYRRSAAYGGAAGSVGWRKQQRVTRTALYFLGRHGDREDSPVRFDVVAVCGDLKRPDIKWLRSAFAPPARLA